MNWLNHDHKNFESTVYQCRSACDEGDWAAVERLFTELSVRYQSHVLIEEEVLFPAYDALPGASSEPTNSLKADHTQIFRLMGRITEHLGQGKHDNLAEDISLLFRILARHHEKEEEIFLPMASEALYSDKDAILEVLKNRGAKKPGK